MSDVDLLTHVSVELVQHVGDDSSVVAAARVSTAGMRSIEHLHKMDENKPAGLINFLMRDRHGTPFEHNSFTFLVHAPIFVFREFQRHRMWSYNEESGRYRELSAVFYTPAMNRPLLQVGKPGAYEYREGTSEQHMRTVNLMADTYQAAFNAYRQMLDDGVAREIARAVLPVGLFSSMYATCNARSLMHFLSLRTKKDNAAVASFPQWEIEMVADQMESLWSAKMPLTHAAFERHGRVAP